MKMSHRVKMVTRSAGGAPTRELIMMFTRKGYSREIYCRGTNVCVLCACLLYPGYLLRESKRHDAGLKSFLEKNDWLFSRAAKPCVDFSVCCYCV